MKPLRFIEKDMRGRRKNAEAISGQNLVEHAELWKRQMPFMRQDPRQTAVEPGHARRRDHKGMQTVQKLQKRLKTVL
jgi:hypothetical protein